MSFFEELKRRNVVRVGIAYVLLGWALLQGADFTLDLVGAPEWVIRALTVVVAIGLPIALFFAWAFELTPEGIKRESEIDRTQSVAPETGRKLDRAIIIILALVIVVMGLERYWEMASVTTPPAVEATADQTTTDTETRTDADPSDPGETTDPAPDPKSVAVLPFVNMSPDADNEFFSDGVSEEILNVLAGVPELKVASRTSAFRYKNSDKAIETIARELGVSHVLEGSVRKAGNQVRITAQLIQADDGFHLWSETYDRELDNIFAIQDEIAGNIAEVLEVQLLGQGKPYTEVADLTPENYEKFLKANFLMRQRNDQALLQARELLAAILAEAPDFPRGLAMQAEAMIQLERFDGRKSEEDIESAIQQIEAMAERALALEPDLAVAHMILGNLAQTRMQIIEAIEQLEYAIALDPGEPRPYHWLGIAQANSGYLEEALASLQMAVDLEPDHANANGYLGLIHLLLGDYDNAEHYFERQNQLGNSFGAGRQVQVMVLKGELDEAERLIQTLEGLNTRLARRLELFVAAARDPETVDDYLALVDGALDDESQWIDSWNLSMELMILEQFERGLAIELGGYPRLAWARQWTAARALPEFDEQVRSANLPELWDVKGPPPGCRKVGERYDCAIGETP